MRASNFPPILDDNLISEIDELPNIKLQFSFKVCDISCLVGGAIFTGQNARRANVRQYVLFNLATAVFKLTFANVHMATLNFSLAHR